MASITVNITCIRKPGATLEQSSPVPVVSGAMPHHLWSCAISLAINYVKAFRRQYPADYSFTFVPDADSSRVKLVADSHRSRFTQ